MTIRRLTPNQTPGLTDLDPFPFGKAHYGVPMQDVPVGYLHWVWHNVAPTDDNKKKVLNYIKENLNVLKMENRDLIWSK